MKKRYFVKVLDFGRLFMAITLIIWFWFMISFVGLALGLPDRLASWVYTFVITLLFSFGMVCSDSSLLFKEKELIAK